ncbi:ATP-binding protein [Chlorobaculum sp. 24CR]|uniref:ATP-binding protein n=1 Tax=Chlorobaculum sp. 24CR TaxID=2508878 RepID=UPI001FD6BFEA|nr:ATP-binding protein [Chlorobaculum sp. 24CR]
MIYLILIIKPKQEQAIRPMSLFPFSEELVTERLRFENPWWITGNIEAYYSSMSPRLYKKLFLPLVIDHSVKRAVILMGPRRVGKTVLLYHSIQELLDAGHDPQKIAFISIETPVYTNASPDALFRLCRKVTGNADPKGWYVFLDEIQYLKEWKRHLKSLVDSYPETKFVVSGSAAAALKLKSTESGAGRFTEFMLPPLTFNEYIHLLGLQNLLRASEQSPPGFDYEAFDTGKLNEHFLNYINYGGYPEVIFSESIRADPGRYIRSDIVEKVLLRDLPGLYGIKDVQELNSLFTMIAWNSGQEFSLEELSKSSGGVDKNTLKRYIEYLEAAFLVRKLLRTDNSAKRFKRMVQFKIYLTNPSLRSALFGPITATDDHIGAMVETAVLAQWMHSEQSHLWYARWPKGEVDLVELNKHSFKPSWAVEIKWSNHCFERPSELKSLLSFCQTNKLKEALVTTIDKQGTRECDSIKLNFVPAAVYAWKVGNNILYGKETHQKL